MEAWIAAALGGLAAVLVAFFSGSRLGRTKERKRQIEARARRMGDAYERARQLNREAAERERKAREAIEEAHRREQAELEEEPSHSHADQLIEEGLKWRD